MARYFFDASGLVKHYHAEQGTPTIDRILAEPDAEILISRLTIVETLSAFAIKVRSKELDRDAFGRLLRLFSTHVARRRFRVVRIVNVHYNRARELIVRQGLTDPLRTLDALQLGVVLCVHEATPVDYFVCADRRLCEIALTEGLRLIDPEKP